MGNIIQGFRRRSQRGKNKVGPTDQNLIVNSEPEEAIASDTPNVENDKKRTITQQAAGWFCRQPKSTIVRKDLKKCNKQDFVPATPDSEIDKLNKNETDGKSRPWFRRKRKSVAIVTDSKKSGHLEIVPSTPQGSENYTLENQTINRITGQSSLKNSKMSHGKPKLEALNKLRKTNSIASSKQADSRNNSSETVGKPAERTSRKASGLFRRKPDSALAVHQNAGPVGNLVELERTNNANNVIDFALTTIRELIEHEVGEIRLPGGETEINRRIMGMSLRGNARFHKGNLSGLQNIRRVGEAVVFDSAEDGSTTLGFEVELREAEVKYSYELALRSKDAEGDVSGKLKSIRVHLKFKMSRYGEFTVENLEIKNVGTFKVSTTGLGPLNCVASGICAAIGNISKQAILDQLESELEIFKYETNLAIRETTTYQQEQELKTLVGALLEPVPGTSAPPLELPSMESIRLPIMEALSRFHSQ